MTVIENSIQRPPGAHNHTPVSLAELEFEIARAECKKRALNEPSLPLSKLFKSEIGKVYDNNEGLDLIGDNAIHAPVIIIHKY
jgi:hypothetical protein